MTTLGVGDYEEILARLGTARGGTWGTPGVTADDVRARKAVIGDASASLWAAGRALIDEGERRGWSRPGQSASTA